MTNPANLVPEIMRRTMKNLEIIDDLYKEQQRRKFGESPRLATNEDWEPYEVTQLLNSFLGAFAIPWEKLLDRQFSDKALEEVAAFEGIIAGFKQSRGRRKRAHQFVNCIRNAFAHGNIALGKGTEIQDVRLWNCDLDSKVKNWEVFLTVDDLKQIIRAFVAIASKHEDEHVDNSIGKDCPCDPD
jgi:hypothetical protein